MSFLFVDRILHMSDTNAVRGIKHITSNEYYLTHDDNGTLCFIPSLVGEALGQLAAWKVMDAQNFKRRPVAGVAASARLYRPAYIGETILLESWIDSLDDAVVHYHSQASIDSETIFSIEGALGPLLPMDDFIDPIIARQQFMAINGVDLINSRDAAIPEAQRGAHSAPMVFDTVIQLTPSVSIVAEKRITKNAAYFPDHFPRKPVLPMTVLLECIMNLARVFINKSHFPKCYKLLEIRKIKMKTFITPGALITCTISVKKHDMEQLLLSCQSVVDGLRICHLEMVMI